MDLAEGVRREIIRALGIGMGFTIEASHHEVAKGQHEIDFVYDDALKNADRVVTFKYVTKTIAMQEGLRATIMPSPYTVRRAVECIPTYPYSAARRMHSSIRIRTCIISAIWPGSSWAA